MRRLVRAAPLVALAALLGAFFAPLAASGRAFVFRDLVVYAAGQDRVLEEAFARRELPARNPYAYGGVAHLADPSTQTLYLPRLVTAWLFEVPRSLDVLIVFHFVVAALGALRLARALGAGRAGGFAAGAVYAFSGPVLSLQENLPLLAGAAWLPWAWSFVVSADRTPGRKRARSLCLAAVAIALACLGGDLQAATWAAVLACGTALVQGLRATGRRPHVAIGGAAAAVLGLALAAVLLVPAACLRPQTDRREPLSEASAGRFHLAPARACELLVPFPFGISFPEGETAVGGLSNEGLSEPWTETLHVGVTGLVLGLACFADRRRRARALVLGAVAGAGFLLALGPLTPAWGLVRALVPFYGVFRYPEKHTVLLALGLSGLAGLGISALRTREGRGRAARALLGAAVLAALAFIVQDPLRRALAEIVVAARRPHGLELAGKLSSALGWQLAATACALAAAAAVVSLQRRRLAVTLAAIGVAANVAVALRPRLYLGDETLYRERPLGAERVEGPWRLLRFPWPSADPIGRIATVEESPDRRQRERAICAQVRSWTGNVAAAERVQAVHGFSSFVPLAVRDALPLDRFPDPVTLDSLAVRWLVVDAGYAEKHGLAVVTSSSTGVALVDRGERVPRAPPVSFAAPVPGLAAGGALSAIALAVLLVLAAPWKAYRSARRGT